MALTRLALAGAALALAGCEAMTQPEPASRSAVLALGAGASRYRVSWRDEAGEAQERETDDPTALLHQLTSAALARGEGLRDLSVTRPTLEDVYLELTADQERA